MDVVWTLLGIGLIALALRDIFDVLFHPLGRGMIARAIMTGVSAATRRLGPGRTGPLLAGPFSYAAVIASWAGLLALGWSLIFLPQMPDGFVFAAGIDPDQRSGFTDALYLSLVNLTSLGYGDVVPATAAMRILGPVETVFGLGLLTASISWLIAIYNAISRRDSLAHEVRLAKQAEQRLEATLAAADPDLLEAMLASFTAQLIRTRRDLIHFPIIHYFRTGEEDRALANMLPFLRSLVVEASDPPARGPCGCGRRSSPWRSTISPPPCACACACRARRPKRSSPTIATPTKRSIRRPGLAGYGASLHGASQRFQDRLDGAGNPDRSKAYRSHPRGGPNFVSPAPPAAIPQVFATVLSGEVRVRRQFGDPVHRTSRLIRVSLGVFEKFPPAVGDLPDAPG